MKKKIEFMKRESIVLTDAHKKAVQDRLVEVQKQVKKIWGVDIAMPDVLYDLKGMVAGTANASLNRIRLHPIFLSENVSDYIYHTVGHEFAHIIVHKTHAPKPGKKLMSHGPEWQDVMVKLKMGPKGEETWKDVIKHKYDPSSIATKPKRKYGPRKPGGRTVGELMLKIKKLKPEELQALKQRLGLNGEVGPGEVERPLSANEIKAWQETQRLSNMLGSKYSHVETSAVSTSGWAHSVILELEKK